MNWTPVNNAIRDVRSETSATPDTDRKEPCRPGEGDEKHVRGDVGPWSGKARDMQINADPGRDPARVTKGIARLDGGAGMSPVD